MVRELLIHSTVAQDRRISFTFYFKLFVGLNDKLDKGIDLAEKTS